MQRVLLVASLLFGPLGCGSDGDPVDPTATGNDDPAGPRVVLQPSALCSDNPASAVATFEDAALEIRVRGGLGLGATEDLTCGSLSGLVSLGGQNAGIASLVGIQNLTSLTVLELPGNSITDVSPLSGITSLTLLRLGESEISDIGPLSGLTSLRSLGLQSNSIIDISALSGLTSLSILWLDGNSITDISALSGLTSLTQLLLGSNSIIDISALSGLTSLNRLFLNENPGLTNIQPLLDNIGIGAGDWLGLRNTSVSCTDVAALRAKGARVDPRTLCS